MKSNFEFLKSYWPALALSGETAENYIYSACEFHAIMQKVSQL